jgi:hypothetical protein
MLGEYRTYIIMALMRWEGERRDFMAWYDQQIDKVFDNRRGLEQYCQGDVTVLRQTSQIFRRDFI